jgi:DNA-binding beta-propeller fold protein YncE
MGNVIAVINKYGDRVRTIGQIGPKPDQFSAPFKLAVDEDDNIYASDGIKQRFFAYESNGTLIYSAKGHLVDEKEILDHYKKTKPFAVAKMAGIAPYEDKLYIVEKVSGCIQIYNKETGDFIEFLRNKETGKVVLFPGPAALRIDKEQKKIYVACSIARKILVVSIETGEILYEIGRSKTFIGAFMGVSGMGFDPDMNLIVTDSAMHTVQIFARDDGSYMYHMGDPKAIADKNAQYQRSFVDKLNYPTTADFSGDGKLWLFVGGLKGFMVRTYVGDTVWDASVDESEG